MSKYYRRAGQALLILMMMAFTLCAETVWAATLSWKGYTWTIKEGNGRGPGPNNWGLPNAYVDCNGYLHLRITNDAGVWHCAEIYTTVNLGFGTYQWHTDARIDTFDPNVVLGLFPYGPPAIGVDGTNEIDIEYSKWGTYQNNNGWWTVYPARSDGYLGQQQYAFTLEGSHTTSRYVWSSTGVHYQLLGGFQPVGSDANEIQSWTYAPPNPATNVPQASMPLHMDLWLVRGNPPLNGQPVEVVIKDFTAVPTPSLVLNPEFDAGQASWSLGNWAGATSTWSVVSEAGLSGPNAARITITNPGTAGYNVQLRQTLPITAGKKYTISFMAKAAAARTMNVVIQQLDAPWTTYWTSPAVNLTTAAQSFAFNYTAGATDSGTMLEFYLGGNASTVYIDDVLVTAQ